MNAVKTGMANELRSAVLSPRDAERISGGFGETNELTPALMKLILLSTARDIISSMKSPNLKTFLTWVRNNHETTLAMIGYYSRDVEAQYRSWSLNQRNSAWTEIWESV